MSKQDTAGDLAGWDCQSDDKPHTCWFPDCSCPREAPSAKQDTALREPVSPVVCRAMARFYARRAELTTDPAERERLCKVALRHLDAAQRDQHGQPIHPLEGHPYAY